MLKKSSKIYLLHLPILVTLHIRYMDFLAKYNTYYKMILHGSVPVNN